MDKEGRILLNEELVRGEGKKLDVAVGSSIAEAIWDAVVVERVNKVLEGVRNGTLKMNCWTQSSLHGDGR